MSEPSRGRSEGSRPRPPTEKTPEPAVLDIETLEYLSREFTARWPDVARWLRTTTPGTKLHARAHLLWRGFMEGYALAIVRPDDV